MFETTQFTPPSASEIKTALSSADLAGSTSEVIDDELFKQQLTELSKEEIINQIFLGRSAWAHSLLSRIEQRPDIKVYSYSKEKGVLYVMEVPSWNGDDHYSMLVIADAASMRSQIVHHAHDILILNKETSKSLSIKSLFPPFAAEQQHAIAYAPAFENATREDEKEKYRENNEESFGVGTVMGIGEALILGEVHDNATLASALHELGHLWATYLGIDDSGLQKKEIRKADLERMATTQVGRIQVTAMVKETGLSERLANMLGRLLSYKLKGTKFFAQEHDFIYEDSRDDGSAYDALHAQFHLTMYDESENFL